MSPRKLNFTLSIAAIGVTTLAWLLLQNQTLTTEFKDSFRGALSNPYEGQQRCPIAIA